MRIVSSFPCVGFLMKGICQKLLKKLREEQREMSKRLSMLFTAIVLVAVLVMSPGITAFASVADGTYEVNYEMKEAKSENTSIADGYFSKPATLRVENGVKTIQITVTGADMIKELTAPSGPVQVVSEDPNNDTRVVKFRVDGD